MKGLSRQRTEDPRHPRVRLAVGVAVVCAVGLVGTALARAWTSPNLTPPVDVVISMGDGGAIVSVNIENVYPGRSEARRFVMALDRYSLSAHPMVAFDDPEDFEQGCNEPESNSGDVSCGDAAGQGELSTQMDVVVAASRAGNEGTGSGCPASPTWTYVSRVRTLAEAINESPLDLLPGGLLAAGEKLCVEFRFSLPREADNLVQSDLVRFDIKFAAEQNTLANPEIKDLAVKRLQDALPTGDTMLDRVIPKAIDRIRASLAPELWLDDTHLSEHGKKVYDRERQAAHELLKGYTGHDAVADVRGWLVGVDARLAATAIADAREAYDRAIAARVRASRKASAAQTSLTQAATELQRANAAMSAGDTDVALGDYDKAILDFREARTRGERSLSLALEALALLR